PGVRPGQPIRTAVPNYDQTAGNPEGLPLRARVGPQVLHPLVSAQLGFGLTDRMVLAGNFVAENSRIAVQQEPRPTSGRSSATSSGSGPVAGDGIAMRGQPEQRNSP